MSKKIILKIDPLGNVLQEDMFGFGTSCENMSKDIEKILGRAIKGTASQTANYHVPVEQDLQVGV